MRKKLRFVLAALCAAAIPAGLIGTAAPARASAQCPWMDTSKSADQRARALLNAMSLDDKISMVHGTGEIFVYYGMAGQVQGIVEAWYPGIEDGNAIAAILFGDVNPSGKLPETFPKSQSDIPTQTPEQYPGVNGHAVYSERLNVGYRWYDAKGIKPLFPFGFGLSYTTFAYSGLSVSASSSGAVTASFTLKNTGSRPGAEVAQVYVGYPASVGEPPRQLRGYQKVFLNPGESRQVSITLAPQAFAYWDTSRNAWTVAAGTYRLFAGGSSRSLPLQARSPSPDSY